MAIEEPKFQVLEEFSGVELRRMSAYWTVEIELEGDEKEVGNQAFRPLLNYISRGNKASEKIAMTAPVNQQPTGEKIAMTAPVNQEKTGNGKYRIGFVLPEKFNSQRPPEPQDSRLRLRLVPERTLATLRYSGTWSTERFAEKRAALLEAVRASGKWQIAGEPVWSRYDPPFMPWFLRRNEVQVEVKPRR